MAHKEQIEYCNQVKKLYPEYFDGVYVLDAGSLDINGNNQYLFTNSHYIGLDIGEGKNVDIVSKIHELQLPDNTFDTIISTEVFEHDQYYTDSIKNIYRMLKPGGMFLFTCATTGRPEHGTRKRTPSDAPLLQSDDEWQDYYKNLTEDDIKEIFDLDRYFYKYQFIVEPKHKDLNFWGIKNGIWQKRDNRSFHISNSIEKKSNKDYIQLFINTGNGFNQKESIKTFYDEKQSKISFDLKDYKDIKALRFDPLNDYVVVNIKKILLNNQEYKNSLKTNAFYVEEQTYYFYTKDSNIFLDVSDFEDIKEVSFELEYLHIGEDAVKQFSNIFSKILESKNQNIQNLNKEVESKNQNIQNLNKHIEVLKEELTLVYTSKSWQITRPIRKLKKVFKGNKK